MPLADYDIHKIIEDERILIHYQPLVSVKRQALFGFEALARGTTNGQAADISPSFLFSRARELDMCLELDRLCREKAFENFREFHQRNKDVIISVNLDVSVLDQGAAGSNFLLEQARRWSIDPNNIVVEVIESKVENTEALLNFIEAYRKYGFLIGLDDIGAGYSNLDRLALIKPEVLKLDRALITDIHKEFYKYEVVKSLISLGQKLGSLVIAEGVEEAEEAVTLLELGVGVLQGFHFARPGPVCEPTPELMGTIKDVAVNYRHSMVKRIASRKRRFKMFDALMSSIICDLEVTASDSLDNKLHNFTAFNPNIECMYVLDEFGTQISSTVCNPYRLSPNKRFIYQPACKGADHSLRPYFLPIDAGLSKFTTEPYISTASGNMCTTIATVYRDQDGKQLILCADVTHLDEMANGFSIEPLNNL